MGKQIAFAVKVPLWPLPSWLPDAHTEAPTAGSVDLDLLASKLFQPSLMPGATAQYALNRLPELTVRTGSSRMHDYQLLGKIPFVPALREGGDEGVPVVVATKFAPLPLRAQCSCSRDAVSTMLNSFAPADRADMVKDGKVVVTCEFCSSVYQFTPHEAGVEE